MDGPTYFDGYVVGFVFGAVLGWLERGRCIPKGTPKPEPPGTPEATSVHHAQPTGTLADRAMRPMRSLGERVD